jgi:glycosyltransferase involved in cell wall biosynthesis
MWPEPFGRGVIEAAAFGRPSLVCRTGGLGSQVEDGVTGWLAEPDVDGLSAAFRRAADTSVHRAYGHAARARYLERSTKAASLDVLDHELRSLARHGLDDPTERGHAGGGPPP